jgi:hypothetical protein
MSSRTFEALSLQRNPWVMALAGLPLLLGVPAALLAAVFAAPPFGAFVIHALLIGLLTTLYAWKRNPWARRKPTTVRVDDDAVWVGERRYARDEISTGFVVPQGNDEVVRLERRGPDVELVVKNARESQELLGALGLSVSDVVARFSTMSRVRHSMGLTMAAVFGTFGAGAVLSGALARVSPALSGVVMFTALLTLMTVMFLPGRIDVGADGVLVRWLNYKRFVSYADLADAMVMQVGSGKNARMVLTLMLAGGDELKVATGHPSWDFGKGQAIVRRIKDAHTAYGRREPAHAEALVRGEARSHRDWVSALRSGIDHATHRHAALSEELLWRIIEDPSVEPLKRAAAAVSLGSRAGAPRERLARIAEATAAPKLRIAIERAASDNDDAVARALEELEEEEPRQTKRS